MLGIAREEYVSRRGSQYFVVSNATLW